MITQHEPQVYKALASRIDVLLATYNGERFLPELLSSLEQQTHQNWRLLVSDDGSQDQTLQLIEVSGLTETTQIFDGPGLGAGANFISLARQSFAQGAHYAAFCDQDDIWLPDKLERAHSVLEPFGQKTPALYFSTQELVDDVGRTHGVDGRIRHAPSFKNALVQNIAAGCTILMNRPALELLSKVELEDVALHDWLAYLLVTGAGGTALHDPEPSVLYRQHGGNEIGANRGPLAAFRRLMGIFQGLYRARNEKNLRALQKMKQALSPENRGLIEEISEARQQKFLKRVRSFSNFGLYRQSTLQQAILWVAIATGKF